tara:strand:+ start:1664 stop:2107 length:444 start_codon:yes stop_codon:yes gene_type:complete
MGVKMGDKWRWANFGKEEFGCKCSCGLRFEVSEALLDLLQNVRNKVGKPILILSGARCKAHNSSKGVGGAPNSWHIPRDDDLYNTPTLYAADITYANPKDRTARNIYMLYVWASNYKSVGLGIYRNRIHVDARPTGKIARWVNELPR